MAGADEDVDAIVSGHTHLAYNYRVPVQAGSTRAAPVTKRPVVSAGQYGANLNRLEFEFAARHRRAWSNIRPDGRSALKDYDADPATQAIVDDAVAAAAGPGTPPLGELDGPFQRAQRIDPVTGTSREPWWRVDARQPGGRGPAVEDRAAADRAS